MLVIFLAAILFYLQPFLTFLFFLVFLIFTLGWYLLIKKKLNTWGKKRQFHDGKMLKFLNEGFLGHKEIKILGADIKKDYAKILSGTNILRLSNNPIELKKSDLKFILLKNY